MTALNESVVEEAILGWFDESSYWMPLLQCSRHCSSIVVYFLDILDRIEGHSYVLAVAGGEAEVL